MTAQAPLQACSAQGVGRGADGRHSISASTSRWSTASRATSPKPRSRSASGRRRHRRRQHLPRRGGRLEGRRPRHRRPHGHAGDRHQFAGAAQRRSSSSASTPAVLGDRRCRRSARASPSGRPRQPMDAGKVRDLRRRHRQSVLHHRFRRGAARRRDGRDALFKGTQVDGVYSADPKKDPDATRYDRLSHRRGARQGPRGHGHGRDCACARKQHSDNRLFDPRTGRFRRHSARATAGHRRRRG